MYASLSTAPPPSRFAVNIFVAATEHNERTTSHNVFTQLCTRKKKEVPQKWKSIETLIRIIITSNIPFTVSGGINDVVTCATSG